MSDPYEIAYQREKAARLKAEQLLEDKSRALYLQNTQLEESNQALTDNQQQLVQSEKMASVGLLAAGIAHEINNPIGFSLSNLQVMRDYLQEIDIFLQSLADHSGVDITPQLQDSLQLIQQETLADMKDLTEESIEGLDVVKQIVADLRGFSRQNEDKKTMSQVNEGLRASLNVLRNELRYRCEVITDYADLPTVYCNLTKLNQVFANIILNAAHAMKTGGTLTITTRQTEQHIEISISDTGEGIPAKEISKIFDPFYTSKPVGEGTGLGLAISYNIVVEEHHGTIDVDSVPEEGTTFTIRLPIVSEPEDEQDP